MRSVDWAMSAAVTAAMPRFDAGTTATETWAVAAVAPAIRRPKAAARVADVNTRIQFLHHAAGSAAESYTLRAAPRACRTGWRWNYSDWSAARRYSPIKSYTV